MGNSEGNKNATADDARLADGMLAINCGTVSRCGEDSRVGAYGCIERHSLVMCAGVAIGSYGTIERLGGE